MKMKSVKFEGQLSGDTKKEAYLGSLKEKYKFKMPIVGKVTEVKLPKDELNGAFLSILDGPKSLVVNGVPVAKTKVYAGDIKVPENFSLIFKVERVSDTCCKLKADIQGK